MSSRTRAVKIRVDSIKDIEQEIGEHNEALKMLRARRNQLETEAIDLLSKEGLSKIETEDYVISISEMDVPSLKDFMKVWRWAQENDVPEIFQRRINSKAWRERDKKVPGVGTFTKRSLSIRST